jgi:hypothetical protein
MPAYRAIATKTLASLASSVTFSNIPGIYRDLVFVFNGGTASGSDALIRVRLNGATSGYSGVYMVGNNPGVSTGPEGTGEFTLGRIGTGSEMATFNIIDYASTTKHKTGISRLSSGPTYPAAQAGSGRWASTAPVNTVLIFNGTGNFTIGSTFSLYGIEA